MLSTPDFLPADISVPAVRAYCTKWSYNFDYYDNLIDPQWVPAWNKILAVDKSMAAARQSEWLAWIDADVLILRQDIPLESFLVEGKDIAFSTDIDGICTGFFLIRKCLAMESFLKLLCHNYCIEWPWEQTVVKKIIGGDAYMQTATAYIPSSIIQNPRANFSADAFAMHYWGHRGRYWKIKEWMLRAVRHGWKKDAFFTGRHAR